MGKIPEQAKRVFQGVKHDVYQWELDLFDGTKATFEILRRADCVQAIVNVGDKILIQEERQPHVDHSFFSFPGGSIEEGEKPQEAVARELLEETGFEARSWNLLDIQRPNHSIDWAIHIFIGHDAKKIAEPKTDGGEKITPRLVSLDELLDLVDSGAFYRFAPALGMMLVRAKYDQKSRQELKSKIFTTGA